MSASAVRKANVHISVWLVDLRRSPTDADRASLDRAETSRAARFAFARDRDRFVATRAALRTLLAQRLGVTAAEVALGKGANDRPTITASSGLSFNVSHSEDLAAIAMADSAGPLGVDIERIRPVADADALVRAHGTADERVAIERAARPDEAFLRLWTRKEAAAKALGLGIGSIDLRHLEVDIDGPREVVYAGIPLKVVPFDPGLGFAGAVAYGAEFTGQIEVRPYQPPAGRDRHLHPAPLSQASEQHG